jgi:hypothetical protein
MSAAFERERVKGAVGRTDAVQDLGFPVEGANLRGDALGGNAARLLAGGVPPRAHRRPESEVAG